MIILIVTASMALLLAVYYLPPVHNRLSWRVANIRTQVRHYFNPPGEHVFTPGQQAEMEQVVAHTVTAQVAVPTATITLTPPPTPTDYISPTPTHTATPTVTPTPIPESIRLTGVVHEYQSENNCGPATLSMALSFWGWQGNQADTARILRPHRHDRNVMPYEMVAYVETETDLKALVRSGGDIDMLKRLIAAGFPVIIERDMGDVRPHEDWTGHYGVVTGYEDARERLILQDSFVMADYPLAYDNFIKYWRAFNFVYVVIYPPEREPEVLAILGAHADEMYNHQQAAERALQEITFLEGRNLFFAWFNYGTSLVNLGDYYNAAIAYDRAFGEIYETIPSPARPWRMMWYQTGPYFAYYHTGRYQDVIDLANLTLTTTGVREIEETWVWRGRARLALGDVDGAVSDFRTALNYHPGWQVAEEALRNLGVEP